MDGPHLGGCHWAQTSAYESGVKQRLSLRISAFTCQLGTTVVMSAVQTSQSLSQLKLGNALEQPKMTYMHSFFIFEVSLPLLIQNEKAHPGPDHHSSMHLLCFCYLVSLEFLAHSFSTSFLKVYKCKSHCNYDFHKDAEYRVGPVELDQRS